MNVADVHGNNKIILGGSRLLVPRALVDLGLIDVGMNCILARSWGYNLLLYTCSESGQLRRTYRTPLPMRNVEKIMNYIANFCLDLIFLLW